MKHFRTVGVLFILCAVGSAGSRREVYRNQDFGITLPIPPGALLCPVPDDARGIDHGPQLLLGSSDVSLCRKYSGKRYIQLFASYKAEATKLLHDSLEDSCNFRINKPCSPAPQDLYIPRMKTDSGKVAIPDGTIEVYVVTEAGKPNPDFDPTVPPFDYQFSLHTNGDHLEEDLVIFRRVLRTTKISP